MIPFGVSGQKYLYKKIVEDSVKQKFAANRINTIPVSYKNTVPGLERPIAMSESNSEKTLNLQLQDTKAGEILVNEKNDSGADLLTSPLAGNESAAQSMHDVSIKDEPSSPSEPLIDVDSVSSTNRLAEGTSEQKVVATLNKPAKLPGTTEEQEKKREPQSIGEYIEFFYKGKIKSLPETLAQRLTGSSHNFLPELKSALQQQALASDNTLEKTRQLMQISRQARLNKSLESCLREFAADVASLHPMVRSNNLGRSFIFANSEDNPSLLDIWSALQLDKQESKALKENAESNDSLADQSIGKKADGKLNLSKDYAKARRNIFLCAVIWRHGNRGITFSDIMRVLRETTLQVRRKPKNIEEELLELLLSVSSTDSEKIALYAEWANQSLLLQIKRITLLEQNVAYKNNELETLTRQVIEQQELAVQREQKIDGLKVQLGLTKDELSVQRVHARADYETLRAGCLSVLKKDVAELENVEVALSRPIPKVEMAREVVKTVVDSLNSYIRDLEGKR